MSALDRISSLPDELLIQILSRIPTKFAVGTSVLSSRWVDLWTYVPILDLDDSLYLHPQPEATCEFKEDRAAQFMRFSDNVISRNRSHNISRLRIRFLNCHAQCLSSTNCWIQTVIHRNVVECDLRISLHDAKDSPQYLRIPSCQTLHILKININFSLHMPSSGGFPYLKKLDVDFSPYETDDQIRTELFTSLPRLEKLYLCARMNDYCDAVNFNVTGSALRSLHMNLFLEFDETFDDIVVIDAPNLEYLHIEDTCLISYLIKQPQVISEVKLDVGAFCYFDEYENGHTIANRSVRLLNRMCDAKSLSLSSSTVEALIFADSKRLPVFGSLAKLDFYLYPSGWNLFLHFLESCPNLECLVLQKVEDDEEDPFDVDVPEESNWIAPKSVANCLLFHLKLVELKGLPKVEEEKVVEFLYGNAQVLEKITVDSHEFKEIFINYSDHEEEVGLSTDFLEPKASGCANAMLSQQNLNTSSSSSTTPPILVGAVVRLQSVMSPQEFVAIGTISSIDPRTIVGPRYLGEYWCEVKIEVPLVGAEQLIRPYAAFRTIEDAVGVIVAWPMSLMKVILDDLVTVDQA